MKTLSILLLAMLTVRSSAQSPYRPFPEGNAGWVEVHSWLNGNSEWTTCERTIRFANDTVIAGVTYHQLRSTGDCSWFYVFQMDQQGVFVEPDAVFVRFRQDVGARKVFAYDVAQQQEILWYDFTLGMGGYPVTLDNPFPDNTVDVVALDSMELSDGYHRTWVLGTQVDGQVQDSAYCTIIEGVGSTYGMKPVTGLIPPFEWSDLLACHSAEGAGIYPAGGPPCDLSMAVAPGDPVHAVPMALPNPASTSVRITGTWPTDARYVLVNAVGAVVRSGSLRTPTIDLSDLNPGICILRVQDAAGTRLGTVRVVKE